MPPSAKAAKKLWEMWEAITWTITNYHESPFRLDETMKLWCCLSRMLRSHRKGHTRALWSLRRRPRSCGCGCSVVSICVFMVFSIVPKEPLENRDQNCRWQDVSISSTVPWERRGQPVFLWFFWCLSRDVAKLGDLPSESKWLAPELALIFTKSHCSALRRLVAQQACVFIKVQWHTKVVMPFGRLCFAGGYTTGPKVQRETFCWV